MDTMDSETEEGIDEEQAYVKEELWIPGFSDDSDIEVLSTDSEDITAENINNKLKNSSQILEQNTTHPTLSSYTDVKGEPPDNKDDIITVNLSDSSDDDEKVSTDNANGTDDENILSLSEASHEVIKIEIKPEYDDNSQQSLLKMELESDEEYEMFDFSALSADDVLRVVQNDSEAVDEIASNVNIEDENKPVIICDSDNLSSNPNTDVDNIDVIVVNPPMEDDLTADKVLNVNSIGKIFLTSKETEALNSYVVLKCPNCDHLEESPKEKPIKECKKCRLKLHYLCKRCMSRFFTLSHVYTHLLKFHSQSNPHIRNLNIKTQSVQKATEEIPKNKMPDMDYLKCKKCGIQYVLQAYLEKHKKTCKLVPNLRCKFCSEIVCFKKDLRKHMIVEHPSLFKINDIEYMLDQIVQEGVKRMRQQSRDMETELNIGQELTHNSPVIQTEKKKKEATAKSVAARRTEPLSSLLVAYCVNCRTKTPLHQQQANSTRCASCDEDLIYPCGDLKCPQFYPTAAELAAHVRQRHHPAKLSTYRCTPCDYSTSSLDDLKAHLDLCFEESPPVKRKQLVCPVCRRVFKLERFFNAHRRLCGDQVVEPEPEPAFVCPACAKGFRQRRYLVAHRRVCSATTGSQRRRQQQQQQGTPREFACEDCHRVFRLERWYTAHKRDHCGKERVSLHCAHCRYRSFRRSRLKVHLRCAHVNVYTGRLLRCVKCGLKWTSIYKLNGHMGECTGVQKIERIKLTMRRSRPGAKQWDVFARYPHKGIELV